MKNILQQFMYRYYTKYIRILSLILVLQLCLLAQWSNDPAENLNINPWGNGEKVCSGGLGGAYVVWSTPGQTSVGLWVQAVDRFGYNRWPG